MGEQYRISKNYNLYIFLQRNALIDIKISIIDICYMAPISKTLMFYLLQEWKIKLKCESWKMYHHAGDSCPPNRYRSFKVNANHIHVLLKNEAPVEVVNSLYRCHILDKIRHEEPFAEFCNAQSACGTLSCTWLKCCRFLTKILLVITLSIPWICRMLIHYAFENEEYRSRDEHFRAHGF